MKTMIAFCLILAGCASAPSDSYLQFNRETSQYEIVQAAIPACSQVTISRDITKAANRATECEVR